MRDILSVSDEPEIFRAVVRSVEVDVIDFITERELAHTVKSHIYQTVHIVLLARSVVRQPDLLVSVLEIRLEKTIVSLAPDLSVAAHKVTGNAGDRLKAA